MNISDRLLIIKTAAIATTILASLQARAGDAAKDNISFMGLSGAQLQISGASKRLAVSYGSQITSLEDGGVSCPVGFTWNVQAAAPLDETTNEATIYNKEGLATGASLQVQFGYDSYIRDRNKDIAEVFNKLVKNIDSTNSVVEAIREEDGNPTLVAEFGDSGSIFKERLARFCRTHAQNSKFTNACQIAFANYTNKEELYKDWQKELRDEKRFGKALTNRYGRSFYWSLSGELSADYTRVEAVIGNPNATAEKLSKYDFQIGINVRFRIPDAGLIFTLRGGWDGARDVSPDRLVLCPPSNASTSTVCTPLSFLSERPSFKNSGYARVAVTWLLNKLIAADENARVRPGIELQLNNEQLGAGTATGIARLVAFVSPDFSRDTGLFATRFGLGVDLSFAEQRFDRGQATHQAGEVLGTSLFGFAGASF